MFKSILIFGGIDPSLTIKSPHGLYLDPLDPQDFLEFKWTNYV